MVFILLPFSRGLCPLVFYTFSIFKGVVSPCFSLFFHFQGGCAPLLFSIFPLFKGAVSPCFSLFLPFSRGLSPHGFYTFALFKGAVPPCFSLFFLFQGGCSPQYRLFSLFKSRALKSSYYFEYDTCKVWNFQICNLVFQIFRLHILMSSCLPYKGILGLPLFYFVSFRPVLKPLCL